GDRRHRPGGVPARVVGRALPAAGVTGAAMKQALRGVRWLAALSEEALDDVIDAGQEVRFAAGRTLVGERESGDDWFILVVATAPEAARLTGRMAAVTPTRGSLSRAWRELVVSRARELPFVALLSFLLTLVLIRLLVWAAVAAGAPLFALLRGAYTSGIALVLLSTATALMRFRPGTRRLIAAGCGIGLALIVNELSVFLAFDVFYVDMTTRDPAMVFDVERLYRRSESQWASARG